MLKEFREFALKGNAIDLAVGIIVGASFTTIVNSIVADIIMPPIGLVLGDVDFSNLFWVLKQGEVSAPYPTLADAQAVGAVTINYGLFINSLISFLIITVVLFFLIRSVNRLKRKEEVAPSEPTTKVCPYCLSEVSIKATRCAFCTSEFKGETG
jgi:large conductance mechanosensitive channel